MCSEVTKEPKGKEDMNPTNLPKNTIELQVIVRRDKAGIDS